MGVAFAWGFIAASSLLIGGILALRRPIGLRPMGLIMAFGAGVLISAVSYELVEDAFGAAGGSGAIGLGLFVGAFTFYLGDLAIDRFGGVTPAKLMRGLLALSRCGLGASIPRKLERNNR
jgi:zinc transporter, ZIP family